MFSTKYPFKLRSYDSVEWFWSGQWWTLILTLKIRRHLWSVGAWSGSLATGGVGYELIMLRDLWGSWMMAQILLCLLEYNMLICVYCDVVRDTDMPDVILLAIHQLNVLFVPSNSFYAWLFRYWLSGATPSFRTCPSPLRWRGDMKNKLVPGLKDLSDQIPACVRRVVASN